MGPFKTGAALSIGTVVIFMLVRQPTPASPVTQPILPATSNEKAQYKKISDAMAISLSLCVIQKALILELEKGGNSFEIYDRAVKYQHTCENSQKDIDSISFDGVAPPDVAAQLKKASSGCSLAAFSYARAFEKLAAMANAGPTPAASAAVREQFDLGWREQQECDEALNATAKAAGLGDEVARTPRSTIVEGDDHERWQTPQGASASDRTGMLDWYRWNETCQGSNVTSDSKPCRKRDAIQTALERRGWCWAYKDWTVTPVDFKWHRCSEMAPSANERVSPFIESGTGVDTNDQVTLSEPKLSGPASNLAIYKERAIFFNDQIAKANVLVTCGIMSSDQYSGTVDVLEERRVRDLWPLLTDETQTEAFRSDKQFVKAEMAALFRHGVEEDCPKISTLPWARGY